MLLYDIFYYAKDGTPLAGFDRDTRTPERAPEGNYIHCVCTNWDRSQFWLDDQGNVVPKPAAVQQKQDGRLSDAEWIQKRLRLEHFSDPVLAPLWLETVKAEARARPREAKRIRAFVNAGKKITLYQQA